ncbi:SusC/RagA family TonB-linked outer membrane protein [Chitinophaga sp. 22620]|uniref:SusC/RagA family TonB-linked outer membrane protein n=1 Tax=Chitinophaga sp. 22620 TaxID=3453952 RepID=UPI003F858327
MKQALLFITMMMVSVSLAFAQQRQVTGKVVGDDGAPIAFATVQIKGTTSGTTADQEGNFSLSVSGTNVILIVRSVGYLAKEIPLGSLTSVSVSLAPDAKSLEEVVVTALGMNRQKKSLGYAVQEIKADKITQTKQADLNTAIAGKVAGVQLRGGSGAKFGTMQIRLRGVNNLTGGNPIYVVDGVITPNTAINPDDVASLTVLKGPAATALYGQRASEGAVVITTKKTSGGGIGLTVNHTTTFENVYVLPDYQNEYGGGSSQEWRTFAYQPGTHDPALAKLDGAKYYNYEVDESWGPRMDGTMHAPWYAWDKTVNPSDFGIQKPFVAQPDNVRDFFRTGVANNTTVSFAKSSDVMTNRFSFTNLTRTGVIPNSKQQKNWLSYYGSLNMTDRLTLSTNVNYVNEYLFNVPREGYGTQTTGSFNQWFHRNLEIDKLKEYYKRPDGSFRSWNITSPTNVAPKYWDNPYTEANENIRHNYIQTIYGQVTLNYNFMNGFKAGVIARGTFENTNGDNRVASYTLDPPSFSTEEDKRTEVSYLANIEYEKTIKDFSVRAGAWGELNTRTRYRVTSATAGGFILPDVYNVSNSLNEKVTTNLIQERKVNSLFGYAGVGFRDMLYLDATVRNDISSTLPSFNNSYVYGSLSTSFVFTEVLNTRDWLSFGKVRASVARLGTDTDPYNTQETFALGTNFPKSGSATYSRMSVPDTRPNDSLRPALSTSYEIGTELQFANNRARLDVNYFYRKNVDQIVDVTVPSSSGYSARRINSGEMINKGWEFTIGATPLKMQDFSWDIDVNFAFMRNKVVSIAPDVENLQVALDGSALSFGFVGSPRASLNAKKGSSYGLIMGGGFQRDEATGKMLVDDDGYPLLNNSVELGYVTPDWTGGVASGFYYKSFSLNFSLDFQKGGKFVSISKMFMSGSGLSAETAGLNDKGNPKRNAVDDGGGVKLDAINANSGKPNEVYADTKELYQSYLFSLWENWTYDASYVKLRELAVGYSFPTRMLTNTPFKGINVAVIGQNLWLIHSATKGIDPSELESSWLEGGQLPGTRSIGFNVKVTF